MACNPSIGGSAKGVVAREIDALGGEMGKLADRSKIQIKKKLNSKYGPGCSSSKSTNCQSNLSKRNDKSFIKVKKI